MDFSKTLVNAIKAWVNKRISGLEDKVQHMQESVQSDWDQTDETAANFIVNKPDEIDAALLVSKTGLVELAVVDADNNIYIDESNNIFIL